MPATRVPANVLRSTAPDAIRIEPFVIKLGESEQHVAGGLIDGLKPDKLYHVWRQVGGVYLATLDAGAHLEDGNFDYIGSVRTRAAERGLNADHLKHMVDRFLGWRLPQDFNPDAGISYTRPNYAEGVDATPTGTNLFSAHQALQMVSHMTHGLPVERSDEELTERLLTLAGGAAATPPLGQGEPLLQVFQFAHLPHHLKGVSRPFAELAVRIVEDLPRNPERSVALRKLREAKDCAVTAVLWK